MEYLALTIAVLALLVSALQWLTSRQHSRGVLGQGEIAIKLNAAETEGQAQLLQLGHASWEMQAQQYIDQSQRELAEISLLIYQETKEEALLEQVFATARERVLNAYDAACQAYLDEKIDGQRFRRAQQVNIFRFYENIGEWPELEGRATDYRALGAVYAEWRGPP